MDSDLKLSLTNERGELLWQWKLPANQAKNIKRRDDWSYAAAVARIIEDTLPVEESDYGY